MNKDELDNKIVIYQTEDGKTQLDVKLENETVWLTQAQMTELFQTTKQNISLHINNIFKEGDILESRYAVERRDRTIHSRMREFLLRLRDEESLESVILSNGDGATLSVKKWIKNEEA